MLFNSLKYAVFLPIVLLVFWISPQRWRTPILLAASYVFYMAWRPVYGFLILGLTAINYWFGIRICKSVEHKKAWVVTATMVNLLVLAYFKYFYFLEDIFIALAKPWSGEMARLPVQIILPLGISFFVFEFIHYVVEIYRGKEPVRNFLKFALFPSFFPTQIAGPIKRYQDFVPQLDEVKRFSWDQFDQGFLLILSGLFKKVLLADNLALFVDGGFANPRLFTGIDMWIFSFAFAFQIYFDFGGYADIARGSAQLLGFKVPINFNFPFLSGSITEFWQRWHITLGIWLRNYVFLTLGLTRSRLKAARNLIITMTVAGLWHGAEFHYIFWGMYQGVLLALHREFRLYRMESSRLNFLDTRAGHFFSILLTFLLTTLGMAIFRAKSMSVAWLVIKKMLFINSSSYANNGLCTLLSINYPFIFPSIFVLLPMFFIGQVIINRFENSVSFSQSPRLLRACYAATVVLLLFALSPDNSPRFIYYQF